MATNSRRFVACAAFCMLICAFLTSAQVEETIGEEIGDSEISAVNVFRLPQNVHPLHYKLRIVTHLDDEEGFKFTGKVWIKVSRNDYYGEFRGKKETKKFINSGTELWLGPVWATDSSDQIR